jgi:hypothetical protein
MELFGVVGAGLLECKVRNVLLFRLASLLLPFHVKHSGRERSRLFHVQRMRGDAEVNLLASPGSRDFVTNLPIWT